MVSSEVNQEIEFTWKIENCDFMWHATFHPPIYNTQVAGYRLRSPLISVGNPCHSVFYLNIYARPADLSGYHRILNYELIRLCGSFDEDFTGEVSLIELNDEMTDVPLFNSVFPARGLVLDEDFLLGETLTFQCRFAFSDPPDQYTSYLTELQQNLNKLLLSGELSDLTLHTKDKEFLVHKFLLHKRAPKLLEDLGRLNENCKIERVEVSTMSTPVLQSLLQYIYSGKLDVHPEERVSELYEMCEKYQLEEVNNILHLENYATITTQLKVIRRIMCWKGDVNNAEKVNNDFSVKTIFYEHINFERAHFLVKVSLETIASNTWLNARIECLSSLDEDILMGCTIYLGLEKDYLICEDKDTLIFSARNEIKYESMYLRLNYSSKEMECGLYFQLRLGVAKGRDFNSVDGMIPIHPDHFSTFGMGVLRHHINKLDNGETFNFKNGGDVRLCFDRDAVLSAHKIVLAAWSPVFSCMFRHEMQEKSSGEVNINDIDFETGLRLLRFMYSGVLLKDSFEGDMKLYATADKYQVSSLFNKCSSFLACHLRLTNACFVLVLAYQYSDENLLETVQKYIARRSHAILDSSEWLSLIDTHPRLASKILLRISGDLKG